MTFYHVRVETDEKDKDGKYIYRFECDISDVNIIVDRILVPYLQGKTFLFDNIFMSPLKIRGFKIIRSKISGISYADEQNKSARRNGHLLMFSPPVIFTYPNTEEITHSLLDDSRKIAEGK